MSAVWLASLRQIHIFSRLAQNVINTCSTAKNAFGKHIHETTCCSPLSCKSVVTTNKADSTVPCTCVIYVETSWWWGGERRRVYCVPVAIIKCGFVVQIVITMASGHAHSGRPGEEKCLHGTNTCPCSGGYCSKSLIISLPNTTAKLTFASCCIMHHAMQDPGE